MILVVTTDIIDLEASFRQRLQAEGLDCGICHKVNCTCDEDYEDLRDRESFE